MISTYLNRPRWVSLFLLIIGVTTLLVPSSISTAAPTVEVVVQDPQLHPDFTTCPQTYWYPFINIWDHTAYLTLNVSDPLYSSNLAEWHPLIPQDGYYKVEAFIAGHAPITWCTGAGRTIEHDTTDARYIIHHAYGTSTRSASQDPLSNQWLNLGEYYFYAGNAGFVSLSDLNGEQAYATTVSFSAMRFTYTYSSRPLTYLPMISRASIPGSLPMDVGIVQGQGFDACTLPTISQMQTWWNESPYSFFGLYLGGIHLASLCATATPAWINAVHQQGWSFIPTWVGPQAPCTQYANRISSDPVAAYQEGQQEALAASNAAALKGLTNNGLGGTIIYYDLEPYGISTAQCRDPVKAFMNGWVEKLHELGNKAGAYGSRYSYVSDWSTIAHVPDDIWAAYWYADSYDPYAMVFGIPWLDNLWINHQRVHQYAGDVSNKWGGVTLGIDIDVADGEVAKPPASPLVQPILSSSPSIEDTGWLAAGQGWLVSEEHLYWTSDRGKNWQDISPAPIQMAYFLPSGQVWALSTLNQAYPTIYFSTDMGATWESRMLNLLPEDWKPLQLQFTSPTTGWMVLRKVTSQAFDRAVLLKTADGGLSWQTYDLPTAGRITFDSPSDGWLVNHDHGQIYYTPDGGQTWRIGEPKEQSQVESSLPANTVFSGWLASGVGWAATSTGSCRGEKGAAGFTCQVQNSLWQSADSGETWQQVPMPPISSIKP
jgi:photosystem II stability/assembly factor-like uncharacterized protein